MHEYEDDGQTDSEHEDDDASQLIDEDVSRRKEQRSEDERVRALELLDLGLLLLHVKGQAEDGRHDQDAKGHVPGMGEGHQGKEEGRRSQVVGLVVEQVVDDAVEPTILVFYIWHLGLSWARILEF